MKIADVSSLTSVPELIILYMIYKKLEELNENISVLTGKKTEKTQTLVQYVNVPKGEQVNFPDLLKGLVIIGSIGDPIVAALFKSELGVSEKVIDFRETVNPGQTVSQSYTIPSNQKYIIREIRIRTSTDVSIDIYIDGVPINKIPTSEAIVENPIILPIYLIANSSIEIKATNNGTISETVNIDLIGVEVDSNTIDSAKKYLENLLSGVIF